MNMKKVMWGGLGFLSLGVAYVGVILPGIPFSIPAVFAAYCFAKSSDRMHNWLYNHKLFGPFLTNWETKKVFPRKAKYMMLAFMAFGAYCGWRFPDTPEEYDRRIKAGEKIGLFK